MQASNATICPVIDQDINLVSKEAIAPILSYLQDNQVVTEGVLAFSIGSLTEDGRLDLCKQNLGVDGAAMVVDALQHNDFVKHLLLGTNKIGDEGAIKLSIAIRENQFLETLYLGCNNISAAGANAICEALEDNQDIKSLWFKRNPIGKESVPALIKLLSKNKTIRTLDLVNTCLEDGFLVLFDFLKQNNTIERLYLSGNYLTAEAMESLGAMLATNQHLKALFVSVNPIGDEGAALLAKGLRQNKTLEELSLASCGIGEKGIMALSDVLEEHTSLQFLDLGYAKSTAVLNSSANEINDIAAQKLYETVAKNAILIQINLVKTGLSEAKKSLLASLEGKTIIMDGRNVKNNFAIHPDSRAIKSVYR